MNADLTVIDLVMQASPLVKGVMLILLAASISSWTFILQKGASLRKARKNLTLFEQTFRQGSDLNKLYDHITQAGDGQGLQGVFRSGFKEFLRLNKKETLSPEVVMENTQRAMRVALSEEEEQLDKHLPYLASVGSISVYIGLFGTVWGIMTAFQALGQVQQATLAMVAPGISEALIATALGLFASIPALLAYNRYLQHTQSLLTKYDNLTDEFSGLLQRQLYMRPTQKVE